MSINIERDKLQEALMDDSISETFMPRLVGVGAAFFDKERVYTETSYADKATVIRYAACAGVSTGGGYLQIRSSQPVWGGNTNTYYFAELGVARSTSDVRIYRNITGSATVLGTEAVDLTADGREWILLSATGNTIKLARDPSDTWYEDPTTAVPGGDIKISVSDTNIASGYIGSTNFMSRYTQATYWGAVNYWPNCWTFWQTQIVRNAASPSPVPAAYFEVPVVGSGKLPTDQDGNIIAVGVDSSEELKAQVDPYRVELPEEIEEKPVVLPEIVQKRVNILKRKGWTLEEIITFMPEAKRVEKVNRLALTSSVHVPCDTNGKPTHGTAIVRVYPSTATAGTRSLEDRVKAVKEMPKCQKLKRDDAVKLALERDDKLFIHDLVRCKKHAKSTESKCCKEYIDWREGTIGLKRDLIEDKLMAEYVKEDKW